MNSDNPQKLRSWSEELAIDIDIEDDLGFDFRNINMNEVEVETEVELEEINLKYDPELNFEGELLEHLKKKFPKEYKLTIDAKKKDEPDEDPEDITPGRIGEHMGDRVDDFCKEYEAILKKLTGI